MWSSPYTLDVPCRVLFENIEGVCAKQKEVRRDYGRRICIGGGASVLH